MRSLGSSKAATRLLAGQRALDAGDRREFFNELAPIGCVRHMYASKGAERTVMHDVRVGDGQDDARLVPADPGVEQRFEVDDIGRPSGVCLAFMP